MLRALAAQALAFLLLLILVRVLPIRIPIWVWPLLQGVLAASLAAIWGLGTWWRLFQVLLPFALAWQLGNATPGWIYPTLLMGLLLVFGGGILTRVPLYNSGPAAWEHLLALIPEGEYLNMVDLGAGLGGPVIYLARRRPQAHFTGVEASPLVWLIAWLRCQCWKGGPPASKARDVPPSTPMPCPGKAQAQHQGWKGGWKGNCKMILGSLWKQELGAFDIVFAFLSPAPMPALWEKAIREMRPGALLISHSFEVPGVTPERRISVPGRLDACLLLYRIPDPAAH